MANKKIPNGLSKCEICGEYKGRVVEKDLNWESYFDKENKKNSTEYLTVSCLCDGILCPKCKKNKIHRPISNYYYPEKNQIWHVPYFGGMIPCAECRERRIDILKQFQNIKWGISQNKYKELFSNKIFVNYYPEEKNAITFVELNDNIYILVSAFFIFNDNVHELANITISFYNPDYKRLDDNISEDLFEQNKKDLISFYGEPVYINESMPAELYITKFINWKTEDSKITLGLQSSKDYNSLFLSKNILSDISTISTPPTVSINIVDINKEEEISSYIANQSFIMKQSQQNELEKELEKFYVPMLQKTMECGSEEAIKFFNDILNRAKEISKEGNTANLPINYGDIILKEEMTNKKIKLGLDRKRAEGVTNEDIKWWWNRFDLERSMMLAIDEITKIATVYALIGKNGFNEEEAWNKIPKYCPIFGDPYDSSDSNNKHDPLPFELKNRINVYIEKRNSTNPKQFTKEIDGSPSYNHLLRSEIKNKQI